MRLSIVLSVAIVFIILIVGSLTFFIVNSQIQEDLERNVQRNTNQLIKHTEGIVSLYFDTVLYELEVLSESSLTEQALSEGCEECKTELSGKFTTINNDNPIIENIGLHDSNGVGVAADEGASIVVGKDFSERDYFKGLIQTKKPYISEIFTSATTGNPSLAIGYPILDSEGNFEGYVLATINFNHLETVLEDLQEESHVALLDRYDSLFLMTGERVTESNREDLVINHNFDFITERISLGDEEGYLITNHQGVQYFTGFKKYDYMTVVFSKEYSSAFSFLSVIRNNIFLSVLISLIPGLLITLLVAFLISRPINHLSKDVDEITKGNFEVQLGSSRITEQQNLIDSLSRILASLKLAVLRTGSIEMNSKENEKEGTIDSKISSDIGNSPKKTQTETPTKDSIKKVARVPKVIGKVENSSKKKPLRKTSEGKKLPQKKKYVLKSGKNPKRGGKK